MIVEIIMIIPTTEISIEVDLNKLNLDLFLLSIRFSKTCSENVDRIINIFACRNQAIDQRKCQRD